MKNALVYPTEVCRSSKNLCTVQTSVIRQLSQKQALNGWKTELAFLIKFLRCSEEGNVDVGASVNELGVQSLLLLLARELTALSMGPSWQPTRFLAR